MIWTWIEYVFWLVSICLPPVVDPAWPDCIHHRRMFVWWYITEASVDHRNTLSPEVTMPPMSAAFTGGAFL
jgi:hypothetical protein